MQVAAASIVETHHSAQRLRPRGPVMPRLWQTLRDEYQRAVDRAVARQVRRLGHAGVSDDYPNACRGGHVAQ